jgi:nucleoside-diphosphate-sugar epimerase
VASNVRGPAGYTVLGGTGFIGSRIVSLLGSQGIAVQAPGRVPDDLFCRPLGRVFYCIGLTADFLAKPFETIDAHVGLLRRLLEEGDFDRLVYLSSTRLYDSLPVPLADESMDLRLNPGQQRHLYDLSKALGENLCLNASGGKASVARLSCVYDASVGAPGFMSQVLHRLREGKRFRLDSSTGVVRDYVSLDDTVHSLKAILDADVSGTFNVASGENLSNAEIVDWLNARGFDITLARESGRERMPVCDVSRLHRLGIVPARLRDYLAHYLAGLEGNEAR